MGGLAIPKSIEEADVWTLSKGLHLLNSRDETISTLVLKELTKIFFNIRNGIIERANRSLLN